MVVQLDRAAMALRYTSKYIAVYVIKMDDGKMDRESTGCLEQDVVSLMSTSAGVGRFCSRLAVRGGPPGRLVRNVR